MTILGTLSTIVSAIFPKEYYSAKKVLKWQSKWGINGLNVLPKGIILASIEKVTEWYNVMYGTEGKNFSYI